MQREVIVFQKPDYDVLRRETKFTWSARSAASALWTLAGVPIREFNLKGVACIEAYRKGRPLVREMFGPDVKLPALSTPAVSYGHVNGLGSELIFPDEGEVAHTHICSSLDEGIQALRRPVDFAAAGMAPFFLEFRRQLQRAFPDEPVGFSYGLEGPITTAYELRGDGFFLDVCDRPDLSAEFLKLVTDSILEFHRFVCGVLDKPAVSPTGSGMCDDVSSMIPPRMWRRLVLPFWEQFYGGRTTGRRSAHVEDLRPGQLGFLEEIGLSHYDPSISHKLNPRIISEKCRVPFAWRLGGFHYRTMSCGDVEDFVFQAVADGASSVFTVVESAMCDDETAEKVRAFIRAAKEACSLLAAGASRQDLAQRVSDEGKRRFWSHWPE